MKLLIPLLLLAFLAVPFGSFAQTTESAVNGQKVDPAKEDKATQYVLRALDLFTGGNFIRDTLTKALNFVSNACYYALIQVYRLIGTLLIPIPDFTNPSSYHREAGNVVQDVYSIMVYLGFFFAVAGFVAHIGPQASGLGNGELTVMAFFRLAVALALIFAWPHIFSLISNMATEIGYLIYGQNRVSSSGVFEGIKNMDQLTLFTADPGTNPGVLAGSSSGNIRLYARNAWSVIYTLSLFLCLIGMFLAGRKVSTGDSSGFRLLWGAVIGLILVVSAGAFAKFLLPALSSMDSGNSVATASQTLHSGAPTLPSLKSLPATVPQNDVLDDYAAFVGAFLRIIISLWGLVICVEVLLGKFFQVASLLVLFLLGPVMAGLVSHPRTETIARNGLNLTLNLALNSVIWAIALLGLYLITNITYGVETMGAANLLTSLAILAGLQLVKNSDKFASLFAPGSVGSPRDMGGLWSAAMGTTLMAGRAVSDTQRVLADAGQKGGKGLTRSSIAGAALGSLLPGMGPSQGAKFGLGLAQVGASAFNFVSNFGNTSSNSPGLKDSLQRFTKGRPSNPYDAPGSRAGNRAQTFSQGRKPPRGRT